MVLSVEFPDDVFTSAATPGLLFAILWPLADTQVPEERIVELASFQRQILPDSLVDPVPVHLFGAQSLKGFSGFARNTHGNSSSISGRYQTPRQQPGSTPRKPETIRPQNRLPR